MRIRKNILWITRTAVLTALLVTVQFVTAPLGNQFVTGTAGNFIMILSLLICGPATGITVAVLSPVFASLAGIGPAFPPLIPFIALGNVVFITAWFLLGLLNKKAGTGIRRRITGFLTAAAAACIKFLTLYTGIVKIAVPFILDLNERQSAVLSLAFSYPQIITATIGGVAALVVISPLQKALNSRSR